MELNSKKPLKILIVEDDLVNKTLLESLLAQSSLQIADVLFAESLADSLKSLKNNDIDIVLLDLNLPDSRGLDTLTTILARYPQVAIVVITGGYGEELGLKAVSMGAQDYLQKGKYNVEILTKSINYAIGRKQLHDILNRKQKELEAIFDAAPVGMLLVDENMIVRRINLAIKQMVQKDFRQIVEHKIGIALNCLTGICNGNTCGVVPACSSCLLVQTLKKVFESNQPVHDIEFQLPLKVNEQQIAPWLSLSAEPMIIDEQRQLVVAIDDISNRKAAEEKLKETIELKSQFVSTVSHELRTPLTCMKVGVTIVLDGVVGKINKKQRNFLEIANKNIERLTDLVNDLLDFQKLGAGKMEFDMVENDICQIAEEVHKTMLTVAGKKDITLILELENNLPKVKFDTNRIIQVLTNLINNAIKFTPEQGRVAVRIKPENEELAISIKDTGMGIPKDDLLKIFERFYRVQRPGKEIQGTGLGLAIVNEIVKMHKGRIEVESILNSGTTFTVFLPIPTQKKIPEQTDRLLKNTVSID